MKKYCEFLQNILSAQSTLDGDSWEQCIYDNFTSNGVETEKGFSEIYDDFQYMGKIGFCSKWNRFFIRDHPIEDCYETCKRYYLDQRKAEIFLDEANKILEKLGAGLCQ